MIWSPFFQVLLITKILPFLTPAILALLTLISGAAHHSRILNFKGNAAGCSTILIDNGNETEWKLNEQRQPSYIVKNFKEAAEIILQKTNSRKNIVHAELE